MRRKFGQGAVFLALLIATLCLPLLIEAIFPPGDNSGANLPPERPLRSGGSLGASSEDARVKDNLAWLAGDAGSVLDLEGEQTAEEAAAAQEAAAAAEALGSAEPALDLRPGALLGYTRSWDSLDIIREIYTAGAFFYIKSHTRIQGSLSRLRFKDDADKIYGDAYRLDGAHRLPAGWLLEEALERDEYDHFHGSWNGEARLSGALTPRLGVSIDGGRSDMWERLDNIRDRLHLWQANLGLFYQLMERWWASAFASGGWLSDHNNRAGYGGETGYVLMPRIGLTASVGGETTQFQNNQPTYWSPNFYGYIYGRLRLTRNFERAPFEPLPGKPMTRAERWGYLAEFTGGVNDEGHYEQSMRAGLDFRVTRSLRLRTEFYHLDSKGRFQTEYSENRLNAGAEVRF
ncbi:MAG: hypothetical protein JO102_07655 [Elusimicrobia bacterium]|nr:hypothetical protein [Elusimicrobiota bacterium]